MKRPNLYISQATSYFGRQDRVELVGRRGPEPIRNGETSGMSTLSSFCTANPCPLSCPYPHPLDPRHKGFALHTTWHRCSRSAILLAGQVRAIGGMPANHFGHPRAVHDELRPTVCGSVHDDAATFSMSDRQALGFPRWPPRADGNVGGAGVGSRSRGCCGTVWFCQVGARTCLRSHQARPEERLLPLNVHLTGGLSGTNPM